MFGSVLKFYMKIPLNTADRFIFLCVCVRHVITEFSPVLKNSDIPMCIKYLINFSRLGLLYLAHCLGLRNGQLAFCLYLNVDCVLKCIAP